MDNKQISKLVTTAEVLSILKISRASLYLYMARKNNPFPRPVTKFGGRINRWLADDVYQWIQQQCEMRVS